MNPKNNVRILFYSEIETAEDIFGYILIQANVNHYFNPKLSKGELFDLYESIMIDYTNQFGGSFRGIDVPVNMERFFGSPGRIDKDLKNTIAQMFEENTPISNYLKNNLLSSSVSIEQDNNEVGVLVFDIPTNGELLLGENNNLVKTSNTRKLVDELVNQGVASENDGLLEYRRVTPDGYHVIPEAVFGEIISIVKEQTEKDPEMFFDVSTRLRGSTVKEIQSIHAQIILIIDILAEQSEYIHEPHWSEIVEFAYNYDGDSLTLLTNKINGYHDLITTGQIHHVPHYDEVLYLQDHFVNITPQIPIENAKPLTVRSQFLLAFVDYIGQALSIIEEEGEFFGEY